MFENEQCHLRSAAFLTTMQLRSCASLMKAVCPSMGLETTFTVTNLFKTQNSLFNGLLSVTQPQAASDNFVNFTLATQPSNFLTQDTAAKRAQPSGARARTQEGH